MIDPGQQPLGSRPRRPVNVELSSAVTHLREAREHARRLSVSIDKAKLGAEFGKSAETSKELDDLNAAVAQVQLQLATILVNVENRAFGPADA